MPLFCAESFGSEYFRSEIKLKSFRLMLNEFARLDWKRSWTESGERFSPSKSKTGKVARVCLIWHRKDTWKEFTIMNIDHNLNFVFTFLATDSTWLDRWSVYRGSQQREKNLSISFSSTKIMRCGKVKGKTRTFLLVIQFFSLFFLAKVET